MALKRKLTRDKEAAGSNQQCHEPKCYQMAQSFLNIISAGGAECWVEYTLVLEHAPTAGKVLGFSLDFQTIPYDLFLLWSLTFPTTEEN